VAAASQANVDRAGPDSRHGERTAWLTLATVMVGTLLVGLDRTVVNLAVPDIIGDFGKSVSTAGWIGTAYIISNAIFIPVFGKLADTIGPRRIHLFGLLGFLGTSLLCGLSWNFWILIVFRVLQGFLGAAVFPTALALIAVHFTDPRHRTQAFGIWSAAFAASIALGPLVGGPLIDNLSWRWVFYINFPVCLVALFMLGRFVPHDRQRFHLESFDWVGATLLGASLTALVVVLERGPNWGWGSAEAIVAYVCVIAFGAAFAALERRVADPLVDPGVLRNRTLTTALLVSFVTFAGMVGAMYLLPVFAQTFLGYDATETGFLLMPMAAGLMLVAPFSARLGLPARVMVSLGVATSALGILLLSRIDVTATSLQMTIPLVLLAAGIGMGMAPLTNAATASVPASEFGMASGVLNLTRNLAGAVGIALFGTLLTSLSETNVLNLGDNVVVNQPSPAVMQTLPMLIEVKGQVEAYGDVFRVGSILMFCGALLALTLRRVPGDPGQDEPAAVH
jgi:EmrB/QacA subfamily drug resistance transporter